MVEQWKNRDSRLTVSKWTLIVQWRIPQIPKNLSAQIVYPSRNVPDFNEKRPHRVSVVRGHTTKVIKTKFWVLKKELFLELLL